MWRAWTAVSPDGRVEASKYGERAYDQWSVDELALTRSAPPTAARNPLVSARRTD
jgi:hypothetical protein